jgi:hypothetical protein
MELFPSAAPLINMWRGANKKAGPKSIPQFKGFGFMVFNAILNNISVISWRSVLLVKETSVPWENLDHNAIQCHTSVIVNQGK